MTGPAAVHGHRTGQTIGQARVAGVGGDRLAKIDACQQRTGLGVYRIQVGIAVAVVVTGTEEHHEVGTGDIGARNERLAVGESQVGVGEFPQHAGRQRRFAVNRRRIGHIQGVDAVAAGIQTAHQERVPTAVTELYVARCGGTIHKELVVLVVKRIAEIGEMGEHPIRNIGEFLVTGIGVERMQHAVVGAHVKYCRAVLLRQFKLT
jgi:hypothetical protein